MLKPSNCILPCAAWCGVRSLKNTDTKFYHTRLELFLKYSYLVSISAQYQCGFWISINYFELSIPFLVDSAWFLEISAQRTGTCNLACAYWEAKCLCDKIWARVNGREKWASIEIESWLCAGTLLIPARGLLGGWVGKGGISAADILDA